MNKKLLLGLLALAAAHTAAEAQSRRPHINRAALARLVSQPLHSTVDARTGTPRTGPPAQQRVQAPSPASWGQLIGQTVYDLQTNSATANRVMVSGANTSAVWTQSCAPGSAPNFTNRGIGYNFAADANVMPVTTDPTFVGGTVANCPSNFGLANVRTGWPEVVHTNGNEVVVAHTGTGLFKTSRPVGAGTWTPTPTADMAFTRLIDGPVGPRIPAAAATWPRMVNNGSTVHLVYCDNPTVPLPAGTPNPPQAPIDHTGTAQTPGIALPVVYSRSLDGGLTWDKRNVVLPMFDNASIGSGAVLPNGAANDTVNLGGDGYAIAVNGNYVAVCTSDGGRNAVVAKSSDGGNTWTAQMIDGNFTDADTTLVGAMPDQQASVVSSDGSTSMVIDNSGTIHWFSGTCRFPVKKRAGSPYWSGYNRYYANSSEYLLYWNDREFSGRRPVVIDSIDTVCPVVPNFTPCALASGDAAYQAAGLLSYPTAVVDAARGDVYVIYAAARLGTSNNALVEGQFLRDLYLQRISFAGGQATAYRSKSISRDIEMIADGAAAANGEESMFPSAHHFVENDMIHYQWMSDFEPGTALQGDPVDDENENAVMYDRINVAALSWADPAPLSVRGDLPANVISTSVAPNPTTGKTTLHLNLKQDARATITVRNVLGQEVLRVAATSLTAGANTVSLDLSAQSAGVYFYTVSSDKFSLTQRVVKN